MEAYVVLKKKTMMAALTFHQFNDVASCLPRLYWMTFHILNEYIFVLYFESNRCTFVTKAGDVLSTQCTYT